MDHSSWGRRGGGHTVGLPAGRVSSGAAGGGRGAPSLPRSVQSPGAPGVAAANAPAARIRAVEMRCPARAVRPGEGGEGGRCAEPPRGRAASRRAIGHGRGRMGRPRRAVRRAWVGGKRAWEPRPARRPPRAHDGPAAPCRVGGEPQPEAHEVARAPRAGHGGAGRGALPAAGRGNPGLRRGEDAHGLGRPPHHPVRRGERRLLQPRAAVPVRVRRLPVRGQAQGRGRCGAPRPHFPGRRGPGRAAANPDAGAPRRRRRAHARAG
mmetsp:Transcript_8591/g.28112  ORF Transcript_8591/g.28112 Transcript_8591/m.28112 type:complete len:265 (-) Transcript_8591:789-1583(-)